MLTKLTIICGAIAVCTMSAYTLLSIRSPKPSFVSFEFNKPLGTEQAVMEDELLHITKPQHVKGIYMSSWVAGTKGFRNKLTTLVNETEINSIVIDFKDSSGVVSTPGGEGASIDRVNAGSKRAADLKEYIKELHSHGIYVIARIAVFEDPIYASHHFDQAVQTSSGTLWKDKHNLAWVDASSLPFREYVRDLSFEAYELGFDEINLDYIRFPTDGSKDKIFPLSQSTPKQAVITDFVRYMHTELKTKNIPLSIDVFGQIVSTNDDMNIGQYYPDLLLYTDAISPMVYLSHFYPGYKNLASPEGSPYETIRLSMNDAIRRKNEIGSATEIRPWIQDFSLEIYYGVPQVKAQLQALEDLGLHSYFLWDPKNLYTKDALEKEQGN